MDYTEARLRWLWSEARQLQLGAGPDIDRLPAAPSALEFLRDYVAPNKPCIISNAIAHWPALSRWRDPSYLSSALGPDHRVSLHLTPDGRADSLVPHPTDKRRLCFASAAVRSLDLASALRLISSTASPSSPLVAYAQQQNDCFRSEYSPLAADADPHIPWATDALGGAPPDAVNLWIGNARSRTSFHKDHYENLYAVVSGEKHFLLLPPTEVHRLYIKSYPAAAYKEVENNENALTLELEEPERHVPWCSVDPYPATPEEVARQRNMFPLHFIGPAPFWCTVRAGEMLYLPSMWFHHVSQSPGENGLAIAVNYWYDMKFDIKYAYFNFLQITHCGSPPLPAGAPSAASVNYNPLKFREDEDEDEDEDEEEEEEEDEEEEEEEEDDDDEDGGEGRPWTEEEDTLLVKAWLEVSEKFDGDWERANTPSDCDAGKKRKNPK